MANNPLWWDTTITIYNKFVDDETDEITWYRTIIPNCFWKYAGDKVTIGTSVLETNHIVCRIPQSPKFKEKYEWLLEEDKTTCFTLGMGDIVIKGNVEDDINEYAQGERSSDIISKYKNLQGCMEIERVIINVGIGRNNPHYCIKGI